jgi:hypothetical protein
MAISVKEMVIYAIWMKEDPINKHPNRKWWEKMWRTEEEKNEIYWLEGWTQSENL